jgi:hypothetical protein
MADLTFVVEESGMELQVKDHSRILSMRPVVDVNAKGPVTLTC